MLLLRRRGNGSARPPAPQPPPQHRRAPRSAGTHGVLCGHLVLAPAAAAAGGHGAAAAKKAAAAAAAAQAPRRAGTASCRRPSVRPAAAAPLLPPALPTALAEVPPPPPPPPLRTAVGEAAWAAVDEARSLARAGATAEALALYQDVLERVGGGGGGGGGTSGAGAAAATGSGGGRDDDRLRCVCLGAAGDLLLGRGEHGEAAACYRRALRAAVTGGGGGGPFAAMLAHNAAVACSLAGRRTEALRHLEGAALPASVKLRGRLLRAVPDAAVPAGGGGGGRVGGGGSGGGRGVVPAAAGAAGRPGTAPHQQEALLHPPPPPKPPPLTQPHVRPAPRPPPPLAPAPPFAGAAAAAAVSAGVCGGRPGTAPAAAAAADDVLVITGGGWTADVDGVARLAVLPTSTSAAGEDASTELAGALQTLGVLCATVPEERGGDGTATPAGFAVGPRRVYVGGRGFTAVRAVGTVGEVASLLRRVACGSRGGGGGGERGVRRAVLQRGAPGFVRADLLADPSRHSLRTHLARTSAAGGVVRPCAARRICTHLLRCILRSCSGDGCCGREGAGTAASAPEGCDGAGASACLCAFVLFDDDACSGACFARGSEFSSFTVLLHAQLAAAFAAPDAAAAALAAMLAETARHLLRRCCGAAAADAPFERSGTAVRAWLERLQATLLRVQKREQLLDALLRLEEDAAAGGGDEADEAAADGDEEEEVEKRNVVLARGFLEEATREQLQYYVVVRRQDVLAEGVRVFSDLRWNEFFSPLSVTFTGEPAVDYGGLANDFCAELAAAFVSSFVDAGAPACVSAEDAPSHMPPPGYPRRSAAAFSRMLLKCLLELRSVHLPLPPFFFEYLTATDADVARSSIGRLIGVSDARAGNGDADSRRRRRPHRLPRTVFDWLSALRHHDGALARTLSQERSRARCGGGDSSSSRSGSGTTVASLHLTVKAAFRARWLRCAGGGDEGVEEEEEEEAGGCDERQVDVCTLEDFDAYVVSTCFDALVGAADGGSLEVMRQEWAAGLRHTGLHGRSAVPLLTPRAVWRLVGGGGAPTGDAVLECLEFRNWKSGDATPYLLTSLLRTMPEPGLRAFLRLCCGLTALPHGGLRKRIGVFKADRLYAHTCFAQLSLPEYDCAAALHEALSVAFGSMQASPALEDDDAYS